jgi:hypothetical protein
LTTTPETITKTAANTVLLPTHDGIVFQLPGQKQLPVYAQPMATFEKISQLWATAMAVVLAEDADRTFIQFWQSGDFYREAMLEIMNLLGITNPLESLSPKQIEELIFHCEDVNQALVFWIHDVGIPQLKKK